MDSRGILNLGVESFAVKECILWGYLSYRNEVWHCCWCVDVESSSRSFVAEGESIRIEPSLSANSIGISVRKWRDLDGLKWSSGSIGQQSTDDSGPAEFTIRTITSYENCSNNEIELQRVSDLEFRIRWIGNAYLHGIDADSFELDAACRLTTVRLSGEIRSKEEVNEIEAGEIFASVFPTGDFVQQPPEVQRWNDDEGEQQSYSIEFMPI